MTPFKAAEEAYGRAYGTETRLPELESVISQYAYWSYYYAKNVIKGRWKEGERIIATDAYYAYLYALTIIKGRWGKGEKIILTSSESSCRYALNVVKGRWKEGEVIILRCSYSSFSYAKDVLKWRIKGNIDFYISLIPILWDYFPKHIKKCPDIMAAYFKEAILK